MRSELSRFLFVWLSFHNMFMNHIVNRVNYSYHIIYASHFAAQLCMRIQNTRHVVGCFAYILASLLPTEMSSVAVSEVIRCCWPPPPHLVAARTRWTLSTAVVWTRRISNDTFPMLAANRCSIGQHRRRPQCPASYWGEHFHPYSRMRKSHTRTQTRKREKLTIAPKTRILRRSLPLSFSRRRLRARRQIIEFPVRSDCPNFPNTMAIFG